MIGRFENNHEIYTKSRDFLELVIAIRFPVRSVLHGVYLLRHFRARGIAFQTEILTRVLYLVPAELEKTAILMACPVFRSDLSNILSRNVLK